MRRNLPALFKGRHFEPEIILLCVRWYLRFGLSFRNLEELMMERNLTVDHVSIWRCVQRYAPELDRRCRLELRMTNRSWRVDETYVRVGQWIPQATRSISCSLLSATQVRKALLSEGIAVTKPPPPPGHQRSRSRTADSCEI